MLPRKCMKTGFYIVTIGLMLSGLPGTTALANELIPDDSVLMGELDNFKSTVGASVNSASVHRSSSENGLRKHVEQLWRNLDTFNHAPQTRICEEGTCLNGGICLAVFDNQWKCLCLNDYTGPRCQTSIEETRDVTQSLEIRSNISVDVSVQQNKYGDVDNVNDQSIDYIKASMALNLNASILDSDSHIGDSSDNTMKSEAKINHVSKTVHSKVKSGGRGHHSKRGHIANVVLLALPDEPRGSPTGTPSVISRDVNININGAKNIDFIIANGQLFGPTKLNDCGGQECLNGGVCLTKGQSLNYLCYCTRGYFGDRCENQGKTHRRHRHKRVGRSRRESSSQDAGKPMSSNSTALDDSPVEGRVDAVQPRNAPLVARNASSLIGASGAGSHSDTTTAVTYAVTGFLVVTSLFSLTAFMMRIRRDLCPPRTILTSLGNTENL